MCPINAIFWPFSLYMLEAQFNNKENQCVSKKMNFISICTSYVPVMKLVHMELQFENNEAGI